MGENSRPVLYPLLILLSLLLMLGGLVSFMLNRLQRSIRPVAQALTASSPLVPPGTRVKALPPEPMPSGDLPMTTVQAGGFELRACRLPLGAPWLPQDAAEPGYLAYLQHSDPEGRAAEIVQLLHATPTGLAAAGTYVWQRANGVRADYVWADGQALKDGDYHFTPEGVSLQPQIKVQLPLHPEDPTTEGWRYVCPAWHSLGQTYALGDKLLRCELWELPGAPTTRLYWATPDGQSSEFQRVPDVRVAGAAWTSIGPAPLLLTRQGAVYVYDAQQQKCVLRPELARLASLPQDTVEGLPVVMTNSFAAYVVKDAWEISSLDGKHVTTIKQTIPARDHPDADGRTLEEKEASAKGKPQADWIADEQLDLNIMEQQFALDGRKQPPTVASLGSTLYLLGPDEAALVDHDYNRVTLITLAKR